MLYKRYCVLPILRIFFWYLERYQFKLFGKNDSENVLYSMFVCFSFIPPNETNVLMTLKFVCGKMMRLHLFKLASNLC